MHSPHRNVSVQPAPNQFDLEIPVAIIGAGACGLTAGTACAQAGVEAIIFERDTRPYGSTAMSYGSMCAAGSELQKRTGIKDSPDALAEDILAITKGQTDPDLAIALAHNAPRSGEEMMAMFTNMASEHGATLVTQADVTTLFTDKNDLPCGLQYESPDGILTVKAQAIIIASSGFAANKEFVKTHIPQMANATYYGAEWHSGDALAWAKDLQIEIADLGSYQALGNLAIPHNIVIPHTVMIDGRGHEKALSLFMEYQNGHSVKAYKQAPSIEALAEKITVPTSALKRSFSDIDKLARTGNVGLFGRKFTQDQKLEPPFYAVKVTGALFHTQGGLCIDAAARVRKTDGSIIPNLFAGGGAIRSVSGPAEWGYLPGIGLSTAKKTPRRAWFHSHKTAKAA